MAITGSVGSVNGSSIAPTKITNVQVRDKSSLSRRAGGSLETVTFKVASSGANSVVQCPAYRVSAGQKVQLLGTVGNVGPDQVSDTRETAAAQQGDPIPNGVVVDYPVENTGKLWFFFGGNGDSVQVRIISGQ